MQNENYFTIQGWMIKKELSLAESSVWGLIYGFSQDGESEYYGSVRYIAEALQISNPTVVRILKKLIKLGYIKKTKESHYTARVLKNLAHPVKEPCTVGVKEPLTNKYNTNNNNNPPLSSFNGKEKETAEKEKKEIKYEPIDEKILTAPQTKWKNKKRAERGLAPTFKKTTPQDPLKAVQYFKDKAMEIHGIDFPTLTSPSGKILQGFKRQAKYGELIKIIDWWFEGGGEWCDYKPSNFISENTIENFSAKTNKKIKDTF